MKLYVIIIGLAALIPPLGSDPALVLLRNAEGGGASSSGVVIHPHEAALLFRPAEAPAEEDKALLRMEGEDVSFPKTTSTILDVVSIDSFLDASSFLSSAKVKAGCLRATPEIDCRVGGSPALAGRIVIDKGSIYPLEILDKQLEDKTFKITKAIGFNRWGVHSPLSKISPNRSLLAAAANGTLLVLDVPASGASMTVGKTEIKIGNSSKGDCDEVAEKTGSDPCAILWVLNIPDYKHANGPAKIGDQDDHFELFYDLLETVPVERFVPYLRMNRDLGLVERDPPGGQCLQPRLAR